MAQSKLNRKNQKTDSVMTEVLYQRLGTQWYAFTEKDGELFVGRVDDNVVREREANDSQLIHDTLEFIAELDAKKIEPKMV